MALATYAPIFTDDSGVSFELLGPDYSSRDGRYFRVLDLDNGGTYSWSATRATAAFGTEAVI